jgi:PAS domain S-box-containing protein
MDLPAFILANIEPLIEDWVTFARTLPNCRHLSVDQLRDHAAEMLRAIAADIRIEQTPAEQLAKSRSLALRLSAEDTWAEVHGSDRFGLGFGLSELVAEFRALRAAVVRQWTVRRGAASVDMLGQLTRFNEGIDQAIAESVARFVAEITAQEQADARRREADARKLHEQEQRARLSDERLHMALLEARMAFWEWDPQSDRVCASPTIDEVLGLLPGQSFTCGSQWFDLVHPDDRPRQQALLTTSAGQHEGWHSRFRIVRPRDGNVVWLEERATPVAGGHGRMDFTVLVWDISERMAFEEARREADRRKDRFLATLAHELRNPLAPIRQAAAIARSAAASPAQVRWSIEVIDRQAAKMALLLNDLLDVSRITRGRLEIRCRRVDIAQVVESAIETVSPLVEARQQTLRVEVPPDPLVVNADGLRLSQVVANLLTNASRYSNARSTIRLTVGPQEGDLVLSVADEGIGIPPDQLEAVFEMFWQGAGSGMREGGLGVGLALARGLVQLHGGTLEARSEGLGRGAEMTVRLPLAAPRGPPVKEEPSAESRSMLPERILVIDDNVDAADSLAAWLRVEGHEVRTAYGGLAGLQQAAEFRPDVVLLDLGMPQMDGFEVARRLRAMEGGEGMTIVAISGWGLPADRERTRAAGFDFHLTKPVEETELQPALSEAPRRRQQGGSARGPFEQG